MKDFSILAVFATCLTLLSCGGENSSIKVNEAQVVVSSKSCFHGWVSSERKNTYPTGICNNNGSENPWSSIEIDFPTQQPYIHGKFKTPEGQSYWLSKFKYIACEDTQNGWTIVTGENPSTSEKYSLKHREIREVPPTGQCKQVFEGEAVLSVELDGKSYSTNLSCNRCVY